AGTGGRTRGHRRGGVRRPAAPGRLPGGAAVSAAALARATAFAPASVGNVAIGFDILGFAVDARGDRVTVRRRAAPGVAIDAVRGVPGGLPREPRDNTAERALLAMQAARRPGCGFAVEIDEAVSPGPGG